MSSLTRSSWDDVDLLCLKALHKDPAQRYRSVEAIIRDIDHYTHSEPLEARPENPLYKAKTFLRRNRTPVLFTAAATALIVATVAIFTWRLARERTNALMQAERAEKIQRFILSLFEGEDKEAGPGQDLRVLTLLDRGAPAAHVLSTEPAVQSQLYYTLGTMYMKLGKLDHADAMLQSALDLQDSSHVPDKSALADILTAQGLLRSEQGKPDQAEQLVHRAIAQTGDLPDGGGSHQRDTMGRELTALGEVQISHGRYAPAVEVLQQARFYRIRPGLDGRSLQYALSARNSQALSGTLLRSLRDRAPRSSTRSETLPGQSSSPCGRPPEHQPDRRDVGKVQRSRVG